MGLGQSSRLRRELAAMQVAELLPLVPLWAHYALQCSGPVSD